MSDSPLRSLREGGLYFSTVDYVMFGLLLALSVGIGIYFGFLSKKKQDSTKEYLMGSKTMSIIPVAISLTATNSSAATMLGVPSEIYRYGTQYWAAVICGLITILCIAYLYLPVFFELQATTIFAYLDRRFDRRLRSLASGLYSFATFLVLPVLIYGPAIAFSQVTGIKVYVITTLICIICVFYTTVGGIRAVIWSDTLQFVSMVGGMLFVMILGTMAVGGLDNIYQISEKGGRLVWFNMDPDPTSRSTFWGNTIGLTLLWISSIGVSPECMQRYLSVPALKDSIKVLCCSGISHVIIKMFALFCGLILYTKYATCDPITIGIVDKQDQILPYFVMDIARNFPGLPGIFVAGVFSAALSSLSSSLNSLSGCIYEDFVRQMLPNVSEKTSSNIMKIIVLTLGSISLALVFIVDKLGNLFSITIAINGVTSGTILGMFTLGMAFPRANKQGAFWGSISSLILLFILAGGSYYHIAQQQLNYETLEFRTDGCEQLGFTDWEDSPKFIGTPNSTTHVYFEKFDNSKVPYIFRLGFMYYSVIGSFVVLIVGSVISVMTGGQDTVDESLLWPCIRKIYRKNRKHMEADIKPLNVITYYDLEDVEKENSKQ